MTERQRPKLNESSNLDSSVEPEVHETGPSTENSRVFMTQAEETADNEQTERSKSFRETKAISDEEYEKQKDEIFAMLKHQIPYKEFVKEQEEQAVIEEEQEEEAEP